MKSTQLKPAPAGSISHGTLNPDHLLPIFISTLEGLILLNGDALSLPENFPLRDKLNAIVENAQDCMSDDGNHIPERKGDDASYLLNEDFPDAFDLFAPPSHYFGSHPGDGADFGFWPVEVD